MERNLEEKNKERNAVHILKEKKQNWNKKKRERGKEKK